MRAKGFTPLPKRHHFSCRDIHSPGIPKNIRSWAFTAGVVILLLFMLLLIAKPSHADRPNPQNILTNDKRNLLFSRLSVENGLSQAGINSIAQDRFGYIWIGTQEGLNRYDGNDIIVYEFDDKDPNSLSNNWIWDIFIDSKGNLWIGTDGGGLDRYDPKSENFIHYRHDPNNPDSLSNDRVRVICQDHRGYLWIGTDGGGLDRLDPNTGKFHHFSQLLGEGRGLPSDSILAIHEDRLGILWIGTNGGGLAAFDPETGKITLYRHDPGNPRSLGNDHVRVIFEDKDGMMLIGTYEGGLSIFHRNSNDFTVHRHIPGNPNSLGHNRIRDILQDSDGSYWIATDNGLSEWHRHEGKFITYRNDPTEVRSLSDNRVVSLFQDRGGVLWVGTFNGLNRWNYTSDAFRYIQQASTLIRISNNIVTAIDGDRQGNIWVGTYGGGLNKIDLGQQKTTVYSEGKKSPNSLTDNRVMSVFVDERDIVWIGTRNGGLNRLDPVTGTIEAFQHNRNDPDSISANSITAIYGEANGILWIGTYGGGLNRFDTRTRTFTVYRHDPENPTSIGSDRVVDIYRDSQGTLWIGTEGGGLNRYDDVSGTFVRYLHQENKPDSLSDNVAWKIWEGKDGSLWVATHGGGLNQLSIEQRLSGRIAFKQYRKSDGLVSDTILGVLEDNSGYLWLSSNRGLMRFHPSGDNRIFNHLNGLKSSEFNFNAQYKTPAGVMFFGSPDGLLVFHPNRIRTNLHRPEIAVTFYNRRGPLLRGYSIDPSLKPLRLGYKDDWINFRFSAFDFAAPSKNRYLYKLEGFDKEWTDPGSNRQATYTNLAPGNYQFLVKASNNDGIWNQEGASVAFEVLPPPWKTIWAYIGYLLLALSLFLYFLHKQRQKFQLAAKQKQELERLVTERTNELAERNAQLVKLNDQLKKASATDSLTGLKNRRFLDDFIEMEISAIDRQLSDLGGEQNKTQRVDIAPGLVFMMIDLDGFKLINDTYGHHAGDQALKQVRDILQSCCRESDIIIRWGGDEFLIIGRNTNANNAEKLAERIRYRLAQHTYRLGGDAIGRMSGSIGFALYPFVPLTPGFCSWEKIIAVADRGAYIAKENGRNAWVGLLGNKQTTMEDLSDLKQNLPLLIQKQRIKIRTSIEGELKLSGKQAARAIR